MPIDASGPIHESDVVAVRPVTEVDLSITVGIYAHHVRTDTASFEIDTPDLVEAMCHFHTSQEAGMPYVVAEAGGAPFGYAYAGPHRARPVCRYMAEDFIYLDTAAQGRDVGTLLLEAFIHECQARDFKQMVAVVRGGRESPGSAKLHACCGFHGVGMLEVAGYGFGR